MRRVERGKDKFWPYVFVTVFVFTVVAAISYFYFKPRLAIKSPAEVKEAAKPSQGEKVPLKLYYPRGERLSMEERQGTKKDNPLASAEDVIREYLKPYNVTILELYMDKDGNIYADLSDTLRKEFKGGAIEEYLIVSGLHESLKANISGFRALKILIEGKEIESFGGHIDIFNPIGGEVEGSR